MSSPLFGGRQAVDYVSFDEVVGIVKLLRIHDSLLWPC